MKLSETTIARAHDLLSESVLSDHGSVILPAGCGKTELLVASVAAASGLGIRMPLVLTHTNAGVSAIRRRLGVNGMGRTETRVLTIDSFMLRLAHAFRTLGPPSVENEEDPLYWPSVRESAQSIISTNNVLEIVADSYGLLIVDEYQDCSRLQHGFVRRISEAIPTLVFGDPLQAIFGFGGTTLVDWDDDVVPAFPLIEDGIEISGWRWVEKNEALGEWLLDYVRPRLITGQSIDFVDAPLNVVASTSQMKQRFPYRFTNANGSVLFVLPKQYQVKPFAKNLRGLFPAMQDREMKVATAAARLVDKYAGDGRMLAKSILEFLVESHTGVTALLGKSEAKLATNFGEGLEFKVNYQHASAAAKEAFNQLLSGGSLAEVERVVTAVSRSEGTYCYNVDSTRDLRQALGMAAAGESSTVLEAAQRIRSGRRFSGARPATRSASHTLLIKGLEYESAIVVDAHAFDTKENLYVALTRGSTDLTVMTESSTLGPFA